MEVSLRSFRPSDAGLLGRVFHRAVNEGVA